MIGIAIFDTGVGPCGIAWRGDAVVGTALPGPGGGTPRLHLERRFPGAEERETPEFVRQAIRRVVRLLEGEPVDFADVRLSLDGAAPFERKVYTEALAIPQGETRTYGELARAIGEAGAVRAVGRALGRNPIPIIIPCHRILAADGRSGGFSAPGGVSTKMRLLQIERARRGTEPTLFDDLRWGTAPRLGSLPTGRPSRARPGTAPARPRP
jgi:methylated-DNA-[protein]-cysteine S-methyltransferase